MGSPVAKNAGASAIMADVKTSYTRGVARGGVAKEEAEKRFPPVIAIYEGIEKQLAEKREELSPMKAVLDATNATVDDRARSIYDETYNAIGRSLLDPIFYVLYPEGVSGYVDNDIEGQPLRMEILASLYESNLHPRIPAEMAQRCAAELRADAAALRSALEAVRGPAAEVRQLDAVRVRIAKLAHTELSRFKSALKSAGMSEPEVHEIIPDRGKPAPKKDKKDDTAAA